MIPTEAGIKTMKVDAKKTFVFVCGTAAVILIAGTVSLIRACLQLSRIIAAAICTPARKFLASLS